MGVGPAWPGLLRICAGVKLTHIWYLQSFVECQSCGSETRFYIFIAMAHAVYFSFSLLTIFLNEGALTSQNQRPETTQRFLLLLGKLAHKKKTTRYNILSKENNRQLRKT